MYLLKIENLIFMIFDNRIFIAINNIIWRRKVTNNK